MSEKKNIDNLIKELEEIKRELEIRDIQIQDLLSEIDKNKQDIKENLDLIASLRKQILEYETIEEARAVKYNKLKNKMGPLYTLLLKIKKLMEK